jgi:DNA-binding NarL/FixJ family response regulator
MVTKSSLEHGRASFDRRAWSQAFDAFTQSEGEVPLERDDLERLAWAAALRGQDQAFLGALERLHQACVEAGERRRAARAAYWIAYYLSSFGGASAAGWLARAARLIENESDPCAERGYLLLATAQSQLDAAENLAAQQAASSAALIGERCVDRELVALARSLEGRALVRQGKLAAGLSLLDELMVAVISDELSPMVSGIVYCGVLVTCQQIYALDRAREWTAALDRWCGEQPELVTFTGLCLVHRVEILQLGGAWADASEEVRQICDRFTTADPEVFGDACYQQAELFRLRGDFTAAEEAYRRASENGREPQPGLALLRLAQGQSEVSLSSMRRLLTTTTARWQRARFLPAFVEIALATKELSEARAATSELEEIAREFDSEILRAMAAHARGAVLVATGDLRAGVEPLRHAFAVWQKLGAPYIAARIRVLLATALSGLGDGESAELERAAARKVFAELGASAELTLLIGSGAVSAASLPGSTHGLSRREIEVLRLLATGKTNKAIALELFVSERTIHRHVSNIFAKISVGSRAAATAFAYENGLL